MVLAFCHNEVMGRPSHLFVGRSTLHALLVLILTLSLTVTTTGFQIRAECFLTTKPVVDRYSANHVFYPFFLSSDDWASFQSLDDDDEIVYGKLLDKQDYAEENDPQFVKEAVGALRAAPVIERDSEPILVPAGSQLELTEDVVLGVLAACRNELGTLFGYTAENRGVGITGGVDYVDLDGPSVIVRLKGRFWHTRSTVLDRVSNYLQQRIPEIVEVQIEDPWQLTDEANDVWSESLFTRRQSLFDGDSGPNRCFPTGFESYSTFGYEYDLSVLPSLYHSAMSDILQPPHSTSSVSVLSSRFVSKDKRSNQIAGKKRKYTEDGLKPSSQQTGCSVCKEGEARYKCPKCRSTYCSIDCCRAHKGVCSTACNATDSDNLTHSDASIHGIVCQNNQETISGSKYVSASDLRQLQIDSKRRYTSLSELRQKVMNDQIDEDLGPGWNMSDDMVIAMKSSSWLRNELADIGLQQLISNVVAAPSRLPPNSRVSPKEMSLTTLREKMLYDTKDKYPRFQTFVDKLLCLTNVYERRPLKNGNLTSLDEWLIEDPDMSTCGVEYELFLKPAPRKKRNNTAKVLPSTDEMGSSSDSSEE